MSLRTGGTQQRGGQADSPALTPGDIGTVMATIRRDYSESAYIVTGIPLLCVMPEH